MNIERCINGSAKENSVINDNSILKLYFVNRINFINIYFYSAIKVTKRLTNRCDFPSIPAISLSEVFFTLRTFSANQTLFNKVDNKPKNIFIVQIPETTTLGII
ncbi:hypothetical protein T11_751 [Trichinella zimbabwensis]|uniref:Uncharacterized protein n=1 Tax=Trichinella zimbabwensis TaxID=268475 RepID=A0A0V1I911_9BILA|nr:hypothetical protein T11_751 [Trichinella zimbabwensis]